MTISKSIFLSLAFSLLASGCAAVPSNRGITVAAVEKLPAPLTLAEVERAFGPANQKHGPVSWYPANEQKGMELWFWWQPPENRKQMGKIHSHAEILIAYVTITPENKENIQTIIWPLAARQLDANAALKKLYRDIE
jgi:hypothetical protein